MNALPSRVLVRSPSNIALIKYMGKKEGDQTGLNLPENPSLSMTLSELCTYVELAPGSADQASDQILSRKPEGAQGLAPELSPAGIEKFLRHLKLFRDHADELSRASGVLFSGLDQRVNISSTNTFPHSAGVASSASSFSALTLACFYYFAQDRARFKSRFANDVELRQVLAQFSRLGSGSSCRSFFGPFCGWNEEHVFLVPSQLPELVDLVLITSSTPKSVGSSEAHRRVKTSQEWRGRVGHQTRPERAFARFKQIERAITAGEYALVSTLAYDDFMDMHELFHTSHPPFTYFTTETKDVLDWLQSQEVLPGKPGPQMILTMDAGPNIHVLVNKEQSGTWIKKIQTRFPNIQILKDVASLGPEIL